MNSRAHSRRVAVIGGGAIGLACAFRLAEAGAHVTVFERDAIGAGASGASAGMLAPFAESAQDAPSPPAASAYFRRALALWPRFAAEAAAIGGVALPVRLTGSIVLTGSAGEAAAAAAAAEAAGGRAEPLDRAGLEARQPGLGDAVRHGVFLPEEGHVDPRAALAALAAAVRALGGEIREGARVVGVDAPRGRVERVRFERGGEAGAASCDAAVIASGAGAGLAAAAPSLGSLFPVKGQMVSLAAGAAGLRSVLRGAAYLIPRAADEIWVGASVEPDRCDLETSEPAIARLRRDAAALLPALANAPERRRWAGLRPACRGGVPMVGPDGPAGLHVAVGHYRNGVLAAPAAGELIAALVCGARAPDYAAALAPRSESALTGA